MSGSGREFFSRHKRFIAFAGAVAAGLPRGFCSWLFVAIRYRRSKISLLIRYLLFRRLSEKCGENVVIYDGVHMIGIDTMSVGDNVSIHPMCYLNGSGGLSIGDNVSIAHASTVLTVSHTWDDVGTAIKYNEIVLSPVVIEDDVWIGCGVRILAGSRIATRCIVAAGAVYNDQAGSNGSVFAGVPARNVKNIPLGQRA